MENSLFMYDIMYEWCDLFVYEMCINGIAQKYYE